MSYKKLHPYLYQEVCGNTSMLLRELTSMLVIHAQLDPMLNLTIWEGLRSDTMVGITQLQLHEYRF